MDKPFSQAAENNKRCILALLSDYLKTAHTVLEIGSGTGQHAVYFAENHPALSWQTSDLIHHHAAINQWIASYPGDNVLAPLALDVSHRETWPTQSYDLIYSANTAHIMSWAEVLAMLAMVSQSLKPGGHLILYGPFNRQGEFTSESNANFDAFLKSREPHMGLRCIDELRVAARDQQLILKKIHEMPVNNKIVVFRKECSDD